MGEKSCAECKLLTDCSLRESMAMFLEVPYESKRVDDMIELIRLLASGSECKKFQPRPEEVEKP